MKGKKLTNTQSSMVWNPDVNVDENEFEDAVKPFLKNSDDLCEITFRNGSEIKVISSEECKRNRSAIDRFMMESFQLKWYQRLQIEIMYIWHNILWKLGFRR